MIKGFARLFGLVAVSCALGCSGSVDGSEESVGGSAGYGGCTTNLVDTVCSMMDSNNVVTYRCSVRHFKDSCGQDHSVACGECPTGHACQETFCVANGGQGGTSGTGGQAGSSGQGGSAGQSGAAGFSGTGGTAGQGFGGSAGEAGAAGAAGSSCEPTVKVTTSDYNTGNVPLGSNDAVSFKLTVEATDCADVVVHGVDLMAYSHDPDFIPTDVSWFCAGDCQSPGDFAFSDAKYSMNGQLLMGPQPFKRYDSPDPQYGSAVKAHLFSEFLLKAGTSVTGSVTFDVTAPAVTPIVGKQVFIGLVAFGAHKVGGSSANSADQAKIEWNTAPEESFKVVEAIPTVKLSTATPPSQIVVAGKDTWVLFTEYAVDGPDYLFKRADVYQGDANGDWRDFTAVALAQNGQVLMVGTPDQSFNRWVFEPAAPFPVKSGVIQVWAKVADITLTQGPNDAWYGVARSGHTPSLKLAHLKADWNGAEHDVTAVDHVPPSMTIRRAKPILNQLPVANTVLVNTDSDLIRFQVAVESKDALDPAAISFRQLAFWIEKTSNVQLQNFKLFRSSSEVPPGTFDVKVESVDAENIFLTYVWKDGVEESISGSGNLYAVRATVTGAAQGSWLKTGIIHAGSDVRTGYLTTESKGLLALCPKASSDPATCPFAGFAWSDNSSLLHNPAVGLNGSGDFTWGFQVPGAPFNQLLAAY